VFGTRITVAAVALLLSVGCPGGNGDGGDTTPDPAPPSFASGPPLADPPAGDESSFGYRYLTRVESRLQDRWRGFLDNCRTRLPPTHAFNEQTLAAVLDIEIAGNGALADVRVASSSGNAEFDQVALEIVRDAGAFPAPPNAFLSDDGLVHVAWRFARDSRQAGVAGATLARVEWELAKSVPMLIEAGRLGEAAARIARAPDDGAGADARVGLLDDVAGAVPRSAIASEDVASVRTAVLAAARVRLAGVAPKLRSLATSAVDLELRREAAAALGEVGDAEAVPLLLGIVAGDGEPEYRGAAARALQQLGAGDRAWSALEAALASDDTEAQLSALVVLSYFPASGAVPRIAHLLQGPSDRSVRLAAAAALGAAIVEAGHKAAKPLVTALADRDGAVRAACAQALSDAARVGYRSKIAYWEMVKLLKDKDDRVRAAAASASAWLGGAGFSKELYRLRKESTPAVLAELAGGLGAVPGEDALARLLALSESAEADVRRAAAAALAARSEPAARERLAAWLDDSDLELQLIAIAASDDAERVRALVRDDRSGVRLAALARLIALAGRPATLGVAAELLSGATSPEGRAAIAGAWLSPR